MRVALAKDIFAEHIHASIAQRADGAADESRARTEGQKNGFSFIKKSSHL